MPANGNYLILLTLASIALLLVLILAVKLHAFLAMLLTSMALGLAAGMAPEKVLKSIQAGFGDALGFIAVVVGLGAMIGRFLEQSGGGRALADWLLLKFGKDRAAWALLVAAFLVGLPLFFEVGVVIMAPLVWSVARETKRSLLYYAMPTLAALTIVHSMPLRTRRSVPLRRCSGQTWGTPFCTALRSRFRRLLWVAWCTAGGSRNGSTSIHPTSRWHRWKIPGTGVRRPPFPW